MFVIVNLETHNIKQNKVEVIRHGQFPETSGSKFLINCVPLLQ